MKICLINNLYPPHAVGGAEQIVSLEAESLLKDGHEVVVITTAPGGSHLWREKGLTIYKFEPKNLYFYTDAHKQNVLKRLAWHLANLFHFGSAKHVKEIIEKERPDEVHTHNLMGVSFLIPRMLKDAGIKHVHTLHDVQLVEPSGIIPAHEQDSWRYSGLPTKIYSTLTKRLFSSPSKVIFPSVFLKDFYKKKNFFSDSEWELIHIKKEHLKTVEKVYNSRFVFVGSLVPHKGIEILVEAWNKIQNNRHIHLDIVGSGELEAKVRDWADTSENVTVYGRLSTEQLERVYQRSDVLIFPSIALENRPTVIVEALQHGLFVIATDTGGTKELLDIYSNSEIISPNDVDALVAAIQKKI